MKQRSEDKDEGRENGSRFICLSGRRDNKTAKAIEIDLGAKRPRHVAMEKRYYIHLRQHISGNQ